MDALANYGSGDSDSDAEEQPQEELDTSPQTPQVTQERATGTPIATIAEASADRKRHFQDSGEVPLESEVQRHSWEISEAPKPPTKTKRRVGPIKIILPEISYLSDDDEEESTSSSIPMGSKSSRNVSDSTSKLLSLLPQPKTVSSRGKIMLPSVMTRPKKNAEPATPFVPKSVSIQKKSVIATEDSIVTEDAGDFLGLSTDHSVEEGVVDMPMSDVYGPARQTESPDVPGPSTSDSVHPSQTHNYANADEALFFPTEEDGPAGVISDEKAHKLIYKREMEKWGISRVCRFL